MIKIFIGTEDAQWLPTEVLKHSVLKRTKSPIEFHELKNIPLKLNLKMYTGFSFYRYHIPQACGFEGRALYLDADIVVLCDIEELINLDMQEHGVLARSTGHNSWFTSVMLMDCAKLKHWKVEQWAALINAGMADYDAIMDGGKKGLNHKDFGDFANYWNHLDQWDSTTKIIHYTHVPTQPWKKGGHKFAHVFLKELKSALEAGVVTRQDVDREIAAGHIYPTILEDMESS